MKNPCDIARVGGLAIALGIAAAVSTGAAGVAWADRSDGQDPGSPAATGGAARGALDTGAARGALDTGAARGSAAHPKADSVGRAAERAKTVRGPDHIADGPPLAPRPAAAAPASPRPGSFTPDITAPAPVRITAPEPPPVTARPAVETAVSGIAAPAALVVPRGAGSATGVRTAVRPLPAQAVRSADAPVAARVLAALFGSIPGGAESPVTWVMLAAARRQGSTSRTVVPAATTAVVNHPPVITNVVLSAPNSSTGAVTGTVTASDPDADKITYKTTTSTKGTVAVTTSGVFTYTPTATARHAAAKIGATTATTTDTVTVTVTDAKGAATSRPVTVPILPKNAVPTATKTVGTPSAATGVVTGTVTGADADRDPLTYTTSAPAKGAVTITTAGAFTYTPTATARHGAAKVGATTADKSDAFTVTVADGYGGSLAVPVAVVVSPANSAPTATATIVGKPDPVTRSVTGRVRATDADNDPLTYTAAPATAKGSVALSNGSFTYTPAATSAAGTDTFAVTVSDGYGGSVAVPVTVPIAAPAQPGTLSTFCGCTLMPANTVFHANVSSLPVLAKSATWTALLGGNLFAAWGGDPWMGNTAGMPVNTVAATRAGERVIFNRGYATSGPSIDGSPYAIPDYPLVEGMPSTPAWDRHLLVFQEGTCVSQELYNVANGVELPAADFGDALANSIYASNYGSTWLAEAGVHYTMNSPLYPAIGWANASQLPYLPLILRPDDLTRGSIDHMLGITIAKDRGTGYAWPARAGDGTGTNPDGVPMGTVLRLRSDFDISTYDPATQVILRALQQHGAVVYDSGNPGQNGATLMAMSNGWTGTGYLTAQQQLRTIPLNAFEAVDVLSLAADPATGWAIRSTV